MNANSSMNAKTSMSGSMQGWAQCSPTTAHACQDNKAKDGLLDKGYSLSIFSRSVQEPIVVEF